jgi:hypothetical protein
MVSPVACLDREIDGVKEDEKYMLRGTNNIEQEVEQ